MVSSHPGERHASGGAGPLLLSLGAAAALAGAEPYDNGSRAQPPSARVSRPHVGSAQAGVPASDWVKLVRAYADHMIAFGRDRYGRVHSPLFASTLVRTKPPSLLPAPRFAPAQKQPPMPIDMKQWPGQPSPWVYQRFTNIPTLRNLGSEDAHKETVVGEDVLEDLHLYRTLWKLSKLTGIPRYKAEADAALRWWFTHTQSNRTGLFPWGEHLGWDFRTDDVSYSRPPYDTLFSRIFHEPRAVDFRDMLEVMAALPAADGETYTPLERFAQGLRDWHIWNLEKGYFTRHGDYFGNIKPSGHAEFPRVGGWFFDVWSKAYLASKKPEFRRRMAADMRTLLTAFENRVAEVGYLPFTAKHEDKPGARPDGYSARQVLNMAAKMWLAGDRMKADAPALGTALHAFAAARFKELGTRVAKDRGALPSLALTLAASCDMCQREDLISLFRQAADAVLKTDITGKSRSRGPRLWANRIQVLAAAYQRFGDPRYLAGAEQDAGRAAALFFDEASPLPEVSADPLSLPDGTPFPIFYHAALGCDDLMYALTCLAAAEGSVAAKPTVPR